MIKFILFIASLISSVYADTPKILNKNRKVTALKVTPLTALDILKKVDENMVLESAIITSTMTIKPRVGKDIAITSKSWIKKDDKTKGELSMTQYVSPRREKGKKMLKKGDSLWMYSPEPNDRIIKISGHMLKQSVMGSDLSYDDFMQNESMSDLYNAKLLGKEKKDGLICWQIHLQAKTKEASYDARILWIDTKNFIPRKQELLAKSGKPLKTFEIKEILRVGKKWYPKVMIFKDLLSKGKGTTMTIDDISLTDIPDARFLKSSLRKKG